MGAQLSAGVQFSEIDLTTIVPSVSSTVGALAGFFMWGPVEERQLVSSELQLAQFYGGPTDNNFETWFTAASFLAYADSLILSRALSNNAATAVAGPSYTNATVSTLVVKNELDFANQAAVVANSGSTYYLAKYPGSYGNSLRISVCDSVNAYSSVLAGNATVNTTFSFTVGSNVCTLTCHGPDAGTANSMANTILAQLSINDLIQAGNTTIGTQGIKITGLSITTVNSTSNTATASINLSTIMTLSSNVTQNTCTRFWEFAAFVGTPPTTTPYTSTYGGMGDEMHIIIVDDDGEFSGTKGEILETWTNLSRATDCQGEQGGSLYYASVLNQSSSFVWWAYDRAGSASGLANTMTSLNTKPLNLAFWGGLDGDNEQVIAVEYLARAYDQFASTEDVDISLVMTGKARGGVNGEQLANYLIDNISSYRMDCVVFLSPDRGDVVQNFFAPEQAVANFKSVIRDSSYAFMDSGYKYMYDKYNDLYRWVPLNGDIAGLCVATDNLRDPWWSPAGFNRGFIKNVVKLAFNPDKARRDYLYPLGVNPVVTFPGEGTVLYGDRTCLVKPSAFDRINVRRLFIVLEKAISIAAKYTLFEFNDEFTRAQFRNLVEPYLRDVQGRRGIYDFKVVCDDTNNTPDVIDGNQFVGDIYIKPARSINFIQLNFVAVRTGVDFNEVIGQF